MPGAALSTRADVGGICGERSWDVRGAALGSALRSLTLGLGVLIWRSVGLVLTQPAVLASQSCPPGDASDGVPAGPAAAVAALLSLKR